MENKIKRGNIYECLPLIIGVGIFVLGFLSMFLFSAFYHGNEERNFWFYNAATYGDAICLPGIIISAGIYVRKCEKLIGEYNKKKHQLICHIFALIAGIVGIGIQISWLTGAQSNWTIVNRLSDKVFLGIRFTMMFTGAGLWHAVFFVIALSTIAYWFSRLFGIRMVLSKVFNSRWDMRALLCAFSFCSILYMELHFSDDLESRIYENGYANSIVIYFAIFIAVLCILFICFPLFFSGTKGIINEIIPFFAGGLIAVSACDLILFHKFDVFMVISCALLGLSISWISFSRKSNSEYAINKGESLESLLYTVCIYGGLSNFCSTHGIQEDSWRTIIIVIALLIIWPYFLYPSFDKKIEDYYEYPDLYESRDKKKKGFNPRFCCFLYSIIIAYVITIRLVRQAGCLPVFSDAVDQIIKDNITFPVALGAVCVIKLLFLPIKRIDKKVSISTKLKTLKIWQYIKIFFLSIVCLVWLLIDIKYNARAIDNSFSSENIGLYFFVFLVLGLTTVSSFIIRKVKNRSWRMILTGILTVAIYAFLIIRCPINHDMTDLVKGLNNGLITEMVFSPYLLLVLSFIAQIFGVSFMVRQSFFANAYSIRGYGIEFEAYGKGINILSFAIMFANIILLFLTTISSLVFPCERIPICEILQYFIIMFLGSCIFPFLICLAIREKLPEHSMEIVNGAPEMEIAKDGMCAYFIYVLAAGIPIYLIRYTKTVDPKWQIVFYGLFIMGAIYIVLKWCIENNNEHFIELVNRDICNGLNPEAQKSVKAMKKGMMQNLYKHLRVQNVFAMISTLLYSFIFFIVGDTVIFLFKVAKEDKFTFVQYIEKYCEYCKKTFLPNKDLIK